MIRFSLLFALLLTPTICFAQTVTSSGPVTVVADDDSINNDGIIEFKSGTSTRLIVNGDGTVNILKKLGINNPFPSAAIHVRPTYTDGVTAGENVIAFTNPNGNSFAFNFSQTLQGNNPNDDVMMWGWNVDANTPNEPTLRFSMERQFGTVFEVHLESVTPQGGVQRPWTWTIDRTTGEAVFVTSGTSHFYGAGWLQQGGAELHIGLRETLSMGPFRQQSDSVVFETTANGGAPAKQLRIVPHPNDPAVSQLLFGDSNGIGVANIAGVLEIKKATLPATVSAGPYKVNGTQVLGSQCARILDSNGSLKDNRRAINEVLGCMRSHGLVAQ
jgi:hypothetical protein